MLINIYQFVLSLFFSGNIRVCNANTFSKGNPRCRQTQQNRVSAVEYLPFLSLSFIEIVVIIGKGALHNYANIKFCLYLSRKVYAMDLFLLPKDIRCRIVCILLGAIKLDKDTKEVTLCVINFHLLKTCDWK